MDPFATFPITRKKWGFSKWLFSPTKPSLKHPHQKPPPSLVEQVPFLNQRALIFQVRLCQAFHQLRGCVDEGTSRAGHAAGQKDAP